VRCSTASDDGDDAERSQRPTVLVVVIASVGQHAVGLLTWPPDLAGDQSIFPAAFSFTNSFW
jgi:hypothetical protein